MLIGLRNALMGQIRRRTPPNRRLKPILLIEPKQMTRPSGRAKMSVSAKSLSVVAKPSNRLRMTVQKIESIG